MQAIIDAKEQKNKANIQTRIAQGILIVWFSYVMDFKTQKSELWQKAIQEMRQLHLDHLRKGMNGVDAICHKHTVLDA